MFIDINLTNVNFVGQKKLENPVMLNNKQYLYLFSLLRSWGFS